jgi:O-antigen/teichoic acid export membrane protein
VSVQLDVLLLGYWLPLAQVGYYALARNLAFKADVLNQTLHAVLLPNVSARRGALSLKSYIRRSLARSGLLLALVLLSLPLARPFIVLVYGEPFAPAVGIFIALMLVVGLDLVTSPLILVALPMQRPRLLAVADAIQVALLVLLSIAAIPSLGVYGVILARFVAKLVGAAAVLVPLMVRLRSEEPLALPPDLRPIEGTSPTPPSGDPM